jgi:hypothetical protein
VSLGSLAVPAGVPPGLGGGGHTCSVLIIITEDVVKGSELVDQGQAIVAEALVGWLGGCGWGCCCCALGLHCLLLLRLWGLLGLLGGLLPGRMEVRLYDKRLDAKFMRLAIARFPHATSAISTGCKLNIITSRYVHLSRGHYGGGQLPAGNGQGDV